MYYTVKEVKADINYFLILTFENGEKREFDMKPYLETGFFKELKNTDVFNSAHISFDTVAWSNDADLDPEILFQNSEPVSV